MKQYLACVSESVLPNKAVFFFCTDAAAKHHQRLHRQHRDLLLVPGECTDEASISPLASFGPQRHSDLCTGRLPAAMLDLAQPGVASQATFFGKGEWSASR